MKEEFMTMLISGGIVGVPATIWKFLIKGYVDGVKAKAVLVDESLEKLDKAHAVLRTELLSELKKSEEDTVEHIKSLIAHERERSENKLSSFIELFKTELSHLTSKLNDTRSSITNLDTSIKDNHRLLMERLNSLK